MQPHSKSQGTFILELEKLVVKFNFSKLENNKEMFVLAHSKT